MRLPAQLFSRSKDTHKGDYGHVLILSGSQRFVGAPLLSSLSALRAGAGLLTLGVPKGLYQLIGSKVAPEVMLLPLTEDRSLSLSASALREIVDFTKKTDSVLIGPGISVNIQTKKLVRSLISKINKPLIVDADGLNCLVGNLEVLNKANNDIILTPHPGEMARLCNSSIAYIQKNRKKVAKAFALRYNITLVLKGHETLVVSKSGRVYVNRCGNPGMATAGSGDCLAGILAAFIGQGISSFEAAVSAVYVHGLAGDLAARDKTQSCLIASDIIAYLPSAFKKAEKSRILPK